MFDCTACTDAMKRANGCMAAPRRRDGTEHAWYYPPDRPDNPDVVVDRCPSRVLFAAHDVVHLFRTLNLAGGNVSLTEQNDLPVPYIEALALAAHSQAARVAWEIKNSQPKQPNPGGRRAGK